MLISELSARTGVAVATLKYYLREGLLMPGTATSATRASYAEEHVERVRLVRALVDVGGLSVAATRRVVEALDAPVRSPNDLLGIAHEALPIPGRDVPESPEVADLLADLGWRVAPDAVARRSLTAAIEATRRAGVPVSRKSLLAYADASEQVAAVDLDVTAEAGEAGGLSRMLLTVVAGTVMVDQVLSALRRLAQEHVSTVRAEGR